MTTRGEIKGKLACPVQKGGILLLTGAFGAGHICAADALIAQLSRRCALPACRVDLAEWLMPRQADFIYSTFHRVVQEAPALYNLGYRHTAGGIGMAQILMQYPAVKKALVSRLDRLLEEVEPLLLVAVIPFAGRLYDLYRRETGCDIPLCTCITDAVAHSSWLSERGERYLVSSAGVRDALTGMGVDKKAIAVTGVPVRPPFLAQRSEASRQPGSPKRLLIMGGGWGLMRYNGRFYSSLEAHAGLEVTVLTGSNESLLKELRRSHPAIRAVGYTDRVHEYMSRSDLLLTKPGGVTMFEAIHSGLPMLVEPPVLAQERHNAALIKEMGIGAVLDGGEDPLHAIRRLLLGSGVDRYRNSLLLVKRELEQRCPADELLSMLPVRSRGVRCGSAGE